MSFFTKLKYLLHTHQGEWTTDDGSDCWQRRRCMVCGIIEQRYISAMFSDAVYLFGPTFSPAPSRGESEELPDGRKVSQSTLAVQVVLAAFAYLYKKQLIDIELGERKVLFIKKKTAKVKKLQSTAPGRVYFAAGNSLRNATPGTSGLEAVIFSSLSRLDYIYGISHIYGITQAIIPSNMWGASSNPWREVLQIVKENLLQRGILKQVVKGKVLFITTYKYVVNGDISKDISNAAKQITELQKTLTELQSKGELYQQMLSDIEQGIASRMETDGGD